MFRSVLWKVPFFFLVHPHKPCLAKHVRISYSVSHPHPKWDCVSLKYWELYAKEWL